MCYRWRCSRNLWFLLLGISQIVTVFIFSLGFFSKRLPSFGVKMNADDELSSVLKGCPDDLVKSVAEKPIVAKVVIVLIDAWQEQFYFRRKSMHFLRRLANDGQAVAFTAHVQTPTVTMPRIKAVTAGVIPSFIDVVINFASVAISNDNIIDQLKGKGYRCTFCGDETWLRLFPGRFDNYSIGTTSFYVNDYTEVDDNVTRCMSARLEDSALETWDLMILHYLGLDHIGHSLGGTHNELDKKLAEMDSIIRELYEKLRKMYSSNFSIIVFGDHGMTDAGSHGGSSKLETSVPVVYIDGSTKRHMIREELRPAASIEQVDIAPTLASLFNVPIPVENLGITLLPHIATMDHADLTMLLSVLRNTEQFQMLSTSSDKLNRCVHQLRDRLRGYCTESSSGSVGGTVRECLRDLREIQSRLIRLETDFDDRQIIATIAASFIISIISISIVCFTCLFRIITGFQNDGYFRSTYLAIFVQIFNSASLFASSLVEEEHDLQYFFFSSCLFVMLLEEFHIRSNSNNRKSVSTRFHSRNPKTGNKLIPLLCLIMIHRICCGYIESSRRRWIMEKDIAFQRNESNLLGYCYEILTSIGGSQEWPGDITTVLKESSILQFIFGLLSLVLTGIGLFVLYGRPKKYPQIIHFLISVTLLGIFLRHYGSHDSIAFDLTSVCSVALLLLLRDLSLNAVLWIVFIMRTYNLPLVVLQLLLGYYLALIDAHPFLLILAICSAFFYAGNSNNLSTVDIAVGFGGVNAYQPIRIAMQILLNTYSGPFLVVFGWWQTLLRRKSIDSIVLSQKLNTVLCSIGLLIHLNMSLCLLSLYIQRSHLFVWSVFAPKLLYQYAHLLVITLITALVHFCNKFSFFSTR